MGECANKRVLLVDDEASLRLIGSDVLGDAGYEVIEAVSADEALQILEAAGEVHVLFTDIRMPGSMSGLDLAKVVHARWPAVKILLTSGDTWPASSDIPDDGRFLPKPYRLDVLQHEVDDLLNG